MPRDENERAMHVVDFYTKAMDAGIAPERIYVDPIASPICVEIMQIRAAIEFMKREDLPARSAERGDQFMASEMFLMMQGVDLIEGDVWGHRKDIDEYYSIDEMVMQRIADMQASGANVSDIASAVSSETKLSPEMVRYIIKQGA
jgi:hypothetical protein